MRRPPRPFTVEIKSSRRPASSRTPGPALVDRSRTEPLFQDLLLRGNQEAGQDRRPAQEAARSEAHQVFRRWPAQRPVRFKLLTGPRWLKTTWKAKPLRLSRSGAPRPG